MRKKQIRSISVVIAGATLVIAILNTLLLIVILNTLSSIKTHLPLSTDMDVPTTITHTLPPPASATNTPTSIIFDVTVSGWLDWQSTGVTVHEGQRVQICYIDGTWAGRVGAGPSLPDIWTDAEGTDLEIYYPEFGLSGRFGSLIGKIEDGPTLQIGRSYEFLAAQTGTLFLRIFDTGVNDNAGSIHVQVIVWP